MAVSLKACMMASELQHYNSDDVGVHMSRPPTCREEDWRRQCWNVGMFLGELLSQRKSSQVRWPLWPICKRSDGLKRMYVGNSEIHLSPIGVTVAFAHRFPLLQVFLFAESIKTSHMFRFGAQGKGIRAWNVCKHRNMSWDVIRFWWVWYLYIFPETRTEGVQEGPSCFYPHVGGGTERSPTQVAHSGLRPGHEQERNRQVLTEGCGGK